MLTRREFLYKSLTASVTLGLPLGAVAGEEIRKLVILHTNDTHSRIEPFTEGRYKGMGGVARRAALVEKIRKENEQVLLLDSGDIWQGTPYFNFYKGELEYKLMSQLRYDAATLGNHDFDNGIEGLVSQLPNARFPFVIANYNFAQTPLKEAFQPYKVFQKGPVKVGVFGLGIELKGLVPEKLYGKTVYEDPIAKAKEMVQELRAKQCDLVVCLSHLGYQYEGSKISDHTLATQVPGIDLVLGGHTHTFLEKPTQLQDPEGKEVFVNQVGWAGIYLGRIEVNFEKGGKKKMKGDACLLSENVLKQA
jgi:5'-nucleotidase